VSEALCEAAGEASPTFPFIFLFGSSYYELLMNKLKIAQDKITTNRVLRAAQAIDPNKLICW